jgi:hypothetical protein
MGGRTHKKQENRRRSLERQRLKIKNPATPTFHDSATIRLYALSVRIRDGKTRFRLDRQRERARKK